MVERAAVNRDVVGSSPTSGARFSAFDFQLQNPPNLWLKVNWSNERGISSEDTPGNRIRGEQYTTVALGIWSILR